ncbi:HAMP domain-containing sensor histidine kinase [Nocardioides ferulae]|uniref:HAMP domain-containing sensor histidine kinase n=1 Tax=Nocardioides ferulae TaxID=2340821 RepID=UPI001F0C968A|nr:ATP-binding protein [Nocardioides ferulae]
MAAHERWHYRRSLASRVILLTMMAVGVSVAVVSLGAYVTVRMQLQSTLDESLRERAHEAASSTALEQLTTKGVVPASVLGAADIKIAFVYVNGYGNGVAWQPDQGDRLPLGQPELDVARRDRRSSIRTVTAEGNTYRVVAVPSETSEGAPVALVLGQSLDTQERVLTKLGVVTLVFGLAGVVAAGIAGWGVAQGGLRPVRRLTAAVEKRARTEDLRPLAVEGDDEIARLAAAFNQMLATVAASRDRQRRLVADAGHELRTPLTSLRTNLELLAQADALADAGDGRGGLPPQARAELLDDVRAQIEELSTLVGDLVELARDETTHVVEPVELPEIVEQAVARVRRRAPGVTFDVTTAPWWVVGESGTLERAVTNLLDNAAKWSPPGGTVTVRLEGGALTVDDEGPGIAPEDVPHVFERFWRSEESRTMPGSGLGLSIVRRAADRHAGTVHVDRSPAGGARVVLTLPGSPDPVPTTTPTTAAPTPAGARTLDGRR